MTDDKDQGVAPGYSVILHQITAPRTVQAVMAIIFVCLVVVEVVRGNEPTDLLMIVVSALLGFYFSDVSNPLSGLTNGQSSRLVEAVAQRVEKDIAREKPMPRTVPVSATDDDDEHRKPRSP